MCDLVLICLSIELNIVIKIESQYNRINLLHCTRRMLMKKIGRSMLWIFAVIFILAGFGMFSESVLAGISMLLFGLSLCLLIWKIIQSRFQTKHWMQIIAPIVLFVTTMISMPTVSPDEHTTDLINTAQV